MNSRHFHLLTVSNIGRQTKDCVVITFDIPETLKEDFKFKAGQYLTVRKEIDGQEVRRSYSICTAPFENKMSFAVKEIAGGKFSTFANKTLQIGDKLEVMCPMGNFLIEETAQNFVFFVAGSGITPVISQIKQLLHNSKKSRITLFYGNSNFGSIIFREELESLKNKFLERIAIHHVFTKEKIGIPLMYGRIDKQKCIEFGKNLFSVSDTDAFMLCGPGEMIFDVKETLMEMGVSADKIHFELFSTDGIKKGKDKGAELAGGEADKACEVVIQMDGDIFEFSLDYGGQNILDAALASGADLPYACKGGVCCTCKAKITEGEVIMDLNYALEPDEVAAGYVLLCQSHPRSSNIYIDYDQK